MIYFLILLLVAILGFIGYWFATAKSRTSTLEWGNKPVDQGRPSALRPKAAPEPVADDDDDGTKVRISGPRLVRTMGGLHVGDEMPLTNGLTIGRGQSCTIRLNDEELSSLHAEFRMELGKPVVIDLGSTNGTFVNGTQLTPNIMMPLKDNDQIRLGMTNLIFRDPK